MKLSTTYLKRTAFVFAVAAVAAAVASATAISDSSERPVSQAYVAQTDGDALDRYLANRRPETIVPDALDRYLANAHRGAPDGLDRFLNNAQRESAHIRSSQRHGGV